jgi:hypothetical protein
LLGGCVGSPADTLEQAGPCHPLNAVGTHAGELGIARGEDPSAAGQQSEDLRWDPYAHAHTLPREGPSGALRIERVDTSDRCACQLRVFVGGAR